MVEHVSQFFPKARTTSSNVLSTTQRRSVYYDGEIKKPEILYFLKKKSLQQTNQLIAKSLQL